MHVYILCPYTYIQSLQKSMIHNIFETILYHVYFYSVCQYVMDTFVFEKRVLDKLVFRVKKRNLKFAYGFSAIRIYIEFSMYSNVLYGYLIYCIHFSIKFQMFTRFQQINCTHQNECNRRLKYHSTKHQQFCILVCAAFMDFQFKN